MEQESFSILDKMKRLKGRTRRKNRGNGVAQCTANIGCSSRVNQDVPTPIAHKLAPHNCKATHTSSTFREFQSVIRKTENS